MRLDFDKIRAGDFRSAFQAAMDEHCREIAAITRNPALPSFDNTLAAMERAGRHLDTVARSFFALAGANTNEELQAVEREISPALSRHASAITLDAELFARIDAVHRGRDELPRLAPEDLRLLERVHASFVRGGATLKGDDRERLAEIDAELSSLGTRFSQNILADERAWLLPLAERDLSGLPEFLKSTMAGIAAERAVDGYALTLSRSVVVPFLTYSDRRDLRETAFRAWTSRGENDGPSDNRSIMAEILRLRGEKAGLLGFANYAAYKLDDQMAKTPGAVRALLEEGWDHAKTRAADDAEALRALAAGAGDNHALEPWDWRYYAEKRRRAEFDLDEAELKPYFQLDRMIEAAFDVAGRLFGLTFEPVPDVKAWHPDVKAWSVRDRTGRERGLFLGDYFARSSKRSGAWMSALRGQHKLDGGQTPIIYNICNFARPNQGEPALLSLDDARTLFHEFGHALHGLLSDVTWPSLAGTAVARDFVELPSQLYEHWLTVPEILEKHARHVETGAALPQALLGKLTAARTFDAGFDTVEYTASALVDLGLHEAEAVPDKPLEAERAMLEALGMPRAIVMRHRSPHFAHIFSGDGYSAGYYSYMWSEVLDADAFEAFAEAGDPFDRPTAERLLTHVYSAGNSRDAAALYTAFRGRMPTTGALLKKRGFVAG
ncbi:M3 family metallopeptidase [Aurantimonas marianensis]|uniref:M3 family metallopeptidase n=1 Tax=Aurantimonas marianensis TaxID=2920428 RepID=A0A9X2H765_9HYPH|nr:M3 family metallopeptidase [Aurantimonas marianensis]MCP3056602.1 M3 family metallopeptidase [Aurantimonas marianensis]